MSALHPSPSRARSVAIAPDDIARLMKLVGDIAEQRGCTAAQAIDSMARDSSDGPVRGRSLRLGQYVDRLRRLRLRRNKQLGASLFRDPAWDMLLDLYGAHERGERVSVSALCYASGVPPTTALRHLERLHKAGLVARHDDHSDQRRSWVDPTDKALSGVATMASLLMEEAFACSTAASAAATATAPERERPVHFRPEARVRRS